MPTPRIMNSRKAPPYTVERIATGPRALLRKNAVARRPALVLASSEARPANRPGSRGGSADGRTGGGAYGLAIGTGQFRPSAGGAGGCFNVGNCPLVNRAPSIWMYLP